MTLLDLRDGSIVCALVLSVGFAPACELKSAGDTEGSSGPATTDGSSDTGDTGGEACAIEALYTPWLEVQPYTWVGGGQTHRSCVLVSVTPEAMPPSTKVELQCDQETDLFWIKSGPIPDLAPHIGATLDVDVDSLLGDVTGHDVEWVALRRDGALLYASVRAEVLQPADAGPDMFAPFSLAKVYGLCPLRPTGEQPEGDGFWCAMAAFAQLEVTFDGEAPVLLGTGESIEVPVTGGTYLVEVRQASRGEQCVAQHSESGDTFAFSIVFQPGA